MQPESATFLLAMEFCGGGALASLLEAGTTRTWSVQKVLLTALQIARGIAFLHAHKPPILHRDLKPANILFLADEAKLADFGASRIADDATMTAWAIGTPLFAAPEQLTFQPYTVLVDMWAYGCVLTCIAGHQTTPYGPHPQLADTVLSRVASGSLLPAVEASHPLHELIRDCCRPVTERIHAEEAIARLARRLRV